MRISIELNKLVSVLMLTIIGKFAKFTGETSETLMILLVQLYDNTFGTSNGPIPPC